MSLRGVYFALLPADVEKLRNAENDEQVRQVRAVIQDDIDERWDEPWLFRSTRAGPESIGASLTADWRSTTGNIRCARVLSVASNSMQGMISWSRS